MEHIWAGEFTIQFFSHGPGTSRSVLWLHLLSLASKVNVLLMPEGGGGLQGFQMTGAQHTSFELKPEEFKPVQNLCVILGYSKKVMYYTKINWDGSHGLHEVLKFQGF